MQTVTGSTPPHATARPTHHGENALSLYLLPEPFEGPHREEFRNIISELVLDTLWSRIAQLHLDLVVLAAKDWHSLQTLIRRHRSVFQASTDAGMRIAFACRPSGEKPFTELAGNVWDVWEVDKKSERRVSAAVSLTAWLEDNRWAFFEIDM